MSGLTVTVLHLSDVHLPARPGLPVHGRDADRTLDQVLRAARRWPVDAVVVTGDLVHEGAVTAYARLRRRLGALGVPVRCAPGNYDDPAVLRRLAPEWLSPLPLGDWLLVPLDSCWPGHDAGLLVPAELDRAAALADAWGDRPVALALHHPPVAPCTAPDCTLRNADDLLASLDRRPSVPAVLSGHQHQRFTLQRGSVTFLGGPSTCIQARHPGEDFVSTDEPPAAQLVIFPTGGTPIAHVTTAG